MFGFLSPRPHGLDYRRVYARLCQHQHAQHGIWSLAFHSYEAVFLYQCALDAGAVSAASLPNQRCCRLSARGSLRNAPDAAVGRYCSSFALLLASVKLEDDIRDRGGFAARVGRWLLHKRIERALNYFTRLDPRFRRNVEQLLADHQLLEARGGTIPLSEYVEPTAHSFGYVFGLMAKLPGMEQQRAVLQRLGRELGAAIISFDCAVDWKKDRRRGEFNPLLDEAAVAEALHLSVRHLQSAAGIAREAWGERSRAAATLNAVQARIRRTSPLLESAGATCKARAGFWVRAKNGIHRAFGAIRFATAPVFASTGGPVTPEDLPAVPDGQMPPNGAQQNQVDPNATAATTGKSSNCDVGSCDCAPGCGDCGGCDGCGDCGGCDCNC